MAAKSGLVDQAALDDVVRQLRRQHADELPTNPIAIARALIKHKLLSKWQCQQILEGRYKGFTLGKYRLLDHLGQGGMGTVYLAEHLHMRRKVAVKVLPRSKVDDASYLERFNREARAAAAVDHPNIVRAFDFDSEGDTYYLVMEFVAGRNLKELVDQIGPIDPETAADYIAQAAAGLEHAHAADLVHRDIKPANLLVDDSGRVKVLDLGLALVSQGESTSVTLAHDERVLGTADYLSPEQALNSHDVDHRSDIYSLGCTLYFALVGHAPFPGGSIAQKIAQHQQAQPTDLLALNAEIPAGLAHICHRMMAKDPDDRYQTAREVAEQLEGWLTDIEPESPTDWHGLRLDTQNEPGRTATASAAERPSDLLTAIRQLETGSLSSDPPDVARVEIAPAATDSTIRPRRRRKSTPLWIWICIAALLGVAGWLAWFVHNQRLTQ